MRRKVKQRNYPTQDEKSEEIPARTHSSVECNSLSRVSESLDSKLVSPEVKFSALPSPCSIVNTKPIYFVSIDTRNLIEKIVNLQDKYEFPEEEKVESVIVSFLYGLYHKRILKFWVCSSIYQMLILSGPHIESTI